jgi:signal transduction histidine kinase
MAVILTKEDDSAYLALLLFILNRSKYLVVLLSFLVSSNCVKCQIRYQDSLRKVIEISSSNEQKLNAWILLGLERNSLHADSLQRYAIEARKLAVALHNEEALLESLLMQGSVLNKKGESNAGIALAEREIAKEYSIPVLRHKRRKFYLLKGFILNVINKTKEAQEVFFSVLKQAEKEGDIFVQAAALNGIGWSYQNLNNNMTAIEWYKKGIELSQSSNLSGRSNKEMLAVLHSNIGMAYYPLYKNSGNRKFADSASLYLDSAIFSCRENDFTGIQAISLGTKALLIYDIGSNATVAENMLQEAIGIRKKFGQLYFIITDMGKLSEMYLQSHNYQRSIEASREAIRLADSSGIKSDIIMLYEILARSYREAGQYKEYGNVLAVQIQVQDSINKANSSQSLIELNTKYEVQKKETLIVKQQYSLFRRKIFIYFIIIGTVILLAISLVKFRKIQQQQKNKLAAIVEEEKIRIVLERKVAQEKERERITADLHDDIGATLSSMHIYGDLAKNMWDTQPDDSKKMIDIITGTSKDLMNRMGDIIWSMKPSDEEKFTLEARLRNYCNELLAPKNIVVAFDIETSLAASITNPEVRKNILLIAKEALNNIAKYSGASIAAVSIKKVNGAFELIISDNGKGFDTKLTDMGNGLNNIKSRCAFLEGNCIIESEPGKGVLITCNFPIAIISHKG